MLGIRYLVYGILYHGREVQSSCPVTRRSAQPRQVGNPVLREKVIDEQGGIIELAIWQVPKSTHFPEGVRYRLAYVPAGDSQPAILYDIHRGKTHHRHAEGTEHLYQFNSVDQLIADFRADVERIKAARRKAQS